MFSPLLKTVTTSAVRSIKRKSTLVQSSHSTLAIKSTYKFITTVRNMSSKYNFETLLVSVPKPFVYHVELNRPEKMNAMNRSMWLEIGKCFQDLHEDPDCRVVILSGSGKLFTAGLDFKSAIVSGQEVADIEDVGRKGKFFYNIIKAYQHSMNQLEVCAKPVLAAIHSACIGGGVSLITAADMRYCTKDAWFQVKEVVLGLAADVGALQRLPRVISSDSLARELCYTAREFHAPEALSCGLVSRVFEDKESMLKGVLEIAESIAVKSPVAIQGTKRSLVYSRDHPVQEALEHIALWNQLMLQSEDFTNATLAVVTKNTDVKFAKL